MKKEKSPILVVSCILLLLLLIILPPVFRKYIPKEEVTSNNQTQKQELTILQCNRIFSTDLYQVTAKVKYVNGSVNTNTLTYKKLEALPESFQEPTAEVAVVFLEEYTYLSNLNQIEKKAEEPNPILVISSNTIKGNETDDNLKLYFQNDITSQKEFYTKRGYTCNTMEA